MSYIYSDHSGANDSDNVRIHTGQMLILITNSTIVFPRIHVLMNNGKDYRIRNARITFHKKYNRIVIYRTDGISSFYDSHRLQALRLYL